MVIVNTKPTHTTFILLFILLPFKKRYHSSTTPWNFLYLHSFGNVHQQLKICSPSFFQSEYLTHGALYHCCLLSTRKFQGTYKNSFLFRTAAISSSGVVRPKCVLDVALIRPAAILTFRLAGENFTRSHDKSNFQRLPIFFRTDNFFAYIQLFRLRRMHSIMKKEVRVL